MQAIRSSHWAPRRKWWIILCSSGRNLASVDHLEGKPEPREKAFRRLLTTPPPPHSIDPSVLLRGGTSLVRQEHGHSKIVEHVFGRATQDKVSDAGVAIPAHDKQLRIALDRVLLDAYPNGAILGVN